MQRTIGVKPNSTFLEEYCNLARVVVGCIYKIFGFPYQIDFKFGKPVEFGCHLVDILSQKLAGFGTF